MVKGKAFFNEVDGNMGYSLHKVFKGNLDLASYSFDTLEVSLLLFVLAIKLHVAFYRLEDLYKLIIR